MWCFEKKQKLWSQQAWSGVSALPLYFPEPVFSHLRNRNNNVYPPEKVVGRLKTKHVKFLRHSG